MGCLDVAVDTIEQRLPVELFKVVDKSNNEVVQRHPSILRAYASQKGGKKTELESDEIRTTLLNDLMWTLYARFEAIAEGHRVVHDVIAGIIRREGSGASSANLTRGFKELWKLYQSEVRLSMFYFLPNTQIRLDALAASRLPRYGWRRFISHWPRSSFRQQCILTCSTRQE